MRSTRCGRWSAPCVTATRQTYGRSRASATCPDSWARRGNWSPSGGADRRRVDDVRPSVDAACFRLAQEAVTNALRHARHASEVEVRVDGDDDQVRVTVVDDGRGGPAPTASTPGFGLVGMAERAKLLGGTFDAGPRPGGGWAVAATFPSSGDDMTIRVLIADDQGIVRTGLRMILDAQPGIEVVGEAVDGTTRSSSLAGCAPMCASSTSACPSSTASRSLAGWPGPTWRTHSPSSSSRRSTSTSTSTGRSRRARVGSC